MCVMAESQQEAYYRELREERSASAAATERVKQECKDHNDRVTAQSQAREREESRRRPDDRGTSV